MDSIFIAGEEDEQMYSSQLSLEQCSSKSCSYSSYYFIFVCE